MDAEKLLKWFAEELLPTVVEDGCFDENGCRQTLESCEFESIENFVSSFSSAPCFARLKFRTPSGTKTCDILIKFQHLNPILREKMRTEPQYRNEVKFFLQVLPLFRHFLKSCNQPPEFIDKILPKCYFASDGNGVPEKAFVILEELRSAGFKLSASPTDLDYRHCQLAIERLARFHSLSFAMKLKKGELFEKLKTLFENVIVVDDPLCREQCRDYQGRLYHRGIDYLLNQKNSQIPKEYLENIRERLNPIFEFFKKIYEPSEPLSVLCHGDFNRNNILFRYENREVVEAKLIDFQRVIYGAPTLDLGFLIYMNTSLEFRGKYFDELFQYYYSNLVKNISNITGESPEFISDWIPLRAFREDFERSALFHYVTVAFFLPLMIFPDGEFESDIINKTFKEMAEKCYKQGGEIVSKRISEVLLDFYKRKFYL